VVCDTKTQIIAEACANHLGDPEVQLQMIHAAAEAGADYIKFQSWQAATNQRGQAEEMAQFELTDADHHRLMAAAREAGIGFSTTVFDLARVQFVSSLELDFVKIASPDCASPRLLAEVAASSKKVILSTGMSDWREIERAVEIIDKQDTKLALLHCMYPLADGQYHLARMQTLRKLAPEVGLSDHSAGEDLRASKLAIALGADWIERHFLLSRGTEVKDAAVSIDPAGLRELVEAAKAPEAHRALADQHPELLGDHAPVLSEKVTSFREFYCGRWGANS